jgi:ATP-binding cassette subfamily F protein uup
MIQDLRFRGACSPWEDAIEMALIGLRDLSVSFGGPSLLDGVSLNIEPGERVCLIGRNGSGKTTILKLLSGDILPDHGEVVRRQGLRVALLPQEVPHDIQGPGSAVVSSVLNGPGAGAGEPQESEDSGWRVQNQVDLIMSRLALDPHARFETLSSGLKRRVLLARGLVGDPDLLLLDEPTNHLDIEAIHWMEDFLLKFPGTIVFVTHDRMFLKRLATRIVEVDRGKLLDWSCDYETFVRRREAALAAESEQWHQFDKKLAREEVWIRQGIKARRTRNEGRVRALESMRELRRARRAHPGSVRMRAQEAFTSGKVVIEASGVDFSHGAGEPIVREFTTLILRGEKIGIIGPNGSGKTTLLRLLLGDLVPRAGRLRHGANLQVAYFDQLREQLDGEKSVLENVGGGNDTVLFNGKPRHIVGYLQDFLFSPERARSPVRILSGGERNRLLLARLFTRPFNVLVMDEPTNDLDTETLELLEELLLDYTGTLLLVSHDRAFLNNVVTSTLVLEGQGRVGEYVGGYDDWLRQRRATASPLAEKKSPDPARRQSPGTSRRSLSYREQRELDALPERITALEAKQRDLYEAMSHASFYQKQGKEIAEARNRLEALEREMEDAYQRWEALEAIKAGT